MNKIAQKIFLFSVVSLFLISFTSAAYAALISGGGEPPLSLRSSGPSSLSVRGLIIVIANYVLIIVCFLSLFFEFFNISKIVKYRNTPLYDKKYVKRVVYWLILLLVAVYLILVVNQTMCGNNCGGFKIRLSL